MNRDGPWIALDCGLLRNRKLEELARPAPRLLYIACLLHCGDELTDGYVRAGAMPRLLAESGARRGGRACDVRALERQRLLEPVDGGWMIPGYLDWNPSRAWWEKQREDAARRTKEWRERRQTELASSPSSDRNAIASESLGDGSRIRNDRDTSSERPSNRSTMRETEDGDASRDGIRAASRTRETRREKSIELKQAPAPVENGRLSPLVDEVRAALEGLSDDGIPV